MLTLTQSVNDTTIWPSNAQACVVGGVNTDNWYARSFDLSVGPTAGSPFTVHCVDFGVEQNRPSYEVVVNIYIDTDGGAPTHPTVDLALLGSATHTVPDGAELAVETASLVPPVVVPENATMVVEIFTPSRLVADGGDGGSFFIGSNGIGQTAPTYLRADACGIVNYIDVGLTCFCTFHVVMRIDGEIGGVDCNGNAVPDDFDIASGVESDCNGNGVPDGCEFVPGVGCPGDILLADLNCDALRNGADIARFVNTLTSSGYTCQADMNQNGVLDLFDIPLFVSVLVGP